MTRYREGWDDLRKQGARQRRIFCLRLVLILALSMAFLLALSLLCPPLAGGAALAPIWTATPTVTATPPMWLPSPLPAPTVTPTATPTVGKPPFYRYYIYLPILLHAPDAWTSEKGKQNGE